MRNAADFSSTLNDTRTQKQTEREQQRHQRQMTIAQRRLEMEKPNNQCEGQKLQLTRDQKNNP